MQTNVKLSTKSLTTPTQDPPTSHATLSQLSLFRFQKKFVTLPTLKWVIFTHYYTFLSIVSLISIIMAKQTSLFGKISGKIGSVIFSTSGGETISREYNPHVANPSTMAQVNQRARMKLISQLSASLAPVIAIPKQGLVSSRNAFTKMNFGASMANNGVAQITYENVQLTNGNLALPTLEAERAEESGISINLAENASGSVDRVVYILYRKTSEQKLQLVASVIAEAPGTGGKFNASLPYTEGDIVLYAYGMRDTSESANAKYGNMQVANAVDVARLVAVRNISTEDFQFTQTRGATMFADQNELTPVPEGSARVFVTAFGGGSVTGGGVFTIGQSATVVATAESGYHFVGWKINGQSEYVSNNASYTFTVQGQTDLVAVFNANLPGLTYTVTVRPTSSSAANGTLVSVNGGEPAAQVQVEVEAGQSITLQALIGTASDVTFTEWAIAQGSVIGTANPLTYTPSGNVTIISRWEDGSL